LKVLLKISLLLLFGLVTLSSEASHLVGGYMNYEFLEIAPNGDYRYKIALNIYRDDLNSDVQFAPSIKLGVYLNDNDQNINQIAVFNLVTKYEVKPPGSINCDYYQKLVKIEYALYEGIISLKPNTAGYQLAFEQCCRNEQNNILQDGTGPTQGQTYYCKIPSTSLENSSPEFYGVPSPYMCVNDTNSFLFDAVDKDGDSLVYQVMKPFAGGSIGNSNPDPESTLDLKLLFYNSGYTYLQPFGSGGYISVDPSTGRTLLYSQEIGRFVIGVEVIEYRNGFELSRIRMDLQIDVLNCIPNNPPDIYSAEGKRFVIEEGEELCFDVEAEDRDGDMIFIAGRGVILGDGDTTGISQGTFSDTAGIAEVSSEFCWVPGCDMARNNPYYVYFTAEDNGCPPKFNHLDVEIKVIPFEGATDLGGLTDVCRYNSYQYHLYGGGESSSYEWDISQGLIEGVDNDSIVLIDWSGSGTGVVRVREVSKNGCLGEWAQLNVVINESPVLPEISGKDTVCGNEANLNYAVLNSPTNTYYWETINAAISFENRNEIQLLSYNPPAFTIKVAETNAFGCTSDTAVLEVYVSLPLPLLEGPIVVCPNSLNIIYETTDISGSIYTWGVTGGTQVGVGNTSSITVDWGEEGSGQLSVKETNRFGCVSPEVTLDVSKSYVLGSFDIDGVTDVCEFETGIPYAAPNANGSVFLWTIAGGQQIEGDSTNSIEVDWGSQGIGTVSVYQRAFDNVNGKECLSSTQLLNVNIHQLPIADEIQGPTVLCQYTDTITYSLAGFPNSNYTWSINGNSANIIGQGTNTIKLIWDNSGQFTLSVLELSEYDCPGVIIDTLITIHPKPLTSPIIGDAIICPEDTDNKTYGVSGFSTSTYTWNVEGELNYTGDGNYSISVDWDTYSKPSGLYVLEISDQGCPGDTQFLDIIFDNIAIDLKVVSVGIPDDRMLIEWQIDENTTSSSFQIEKRIANSGSPWEVIGNTPGDVFTYLEKGINTDVTPFEYRVTAVNKCGTLILSEEHTSILIKGFKDEDLNSLLNFTNYLGWENGVSNYDMYGSSNVSDYSVVESAVIPENTVYVEHNPEQYRKCYRIRADENSGENTTSWSNEICFFFSPQVIVPNAFTPNFDNLNDGFGVKGIAIKDFNMQIFSRWGEKLYESNDLEEKWFPVYKGSDVQMGTYIYLIKFTDYQNKVFIKSGTINLLK